MIAGMRAEQAGEVAALHASVLTDSVYTWIGRPFLEYYYRRLLDNPDYACHVHVHEGRITGFLASTSASGAIFQRQILRDPVRLGLALTGSVARNPRAIPVLLSASRFLFGQRPTMLPGVDGEVLSFAVLPEYRTAEVGPDGAVRPTPFYTATRATVAADLFVAAMQGLAGRGVKRVKIMTPADNAASNRFYAKMGSRLTRDLPVFGHPTNLYLLDITDVPSLARPGAQRT